MREGTKFAANQEVVETSVKDALVSVKTELQCRLPTFALRIAAEAMLIV